MSARLAQRRARVVIRRERQLGREATIRLLVLGLPGSVAQKYSAFESRRARPTSAAAVCAR
jgi:hypothetical protein